MNEEPTHQSELLRRLATRAEAKAVRTSPEAEEISKVFIARTIDGEPCNAIHPDGSQITLKFERALLPGAIIDLGEGNRLEVFVPEDQEIRDRFSNPVSYPNPPLFMRRLTEEEFDTLAKEWRETDEDLERHGKLLQVTLYGARWRNPIPLTGETQEALRAKGIEF